VIDLFHRLEESERNRDGRRTDAEPA